MEPTLTWNDVRILMDEVRGIARHLLRREAQPRSLRSLELVLSGLRRQKRTDQEWKEVSWQNREHFLATMYLAMDRALKDHGRRRAAHKCKGHQWVTLEHISPDQWLSVAQYQPQDVEHTIDTPSPVLNEMLAAMFADALTQLETRHPEWAKIVRHRYYALLTIEQTAQLMGMSERTVRRHWEKARILLHDEIVANLRNQGYDIATGPRDRRSADDSAP